MRLVATVRDAGSRIDWPHRPIRIEFGGGHHGYNYDRSKQALIDVLDQLIVKLREKIEEVPAEPRHLLTLGYRLEV